MSYRIIFPIDIDDNNRYTLYDIALISESLGIVRYKMWHGSLLRCSTLEEGLKLARKILKSFENGKKCPCEQEICRIVERPNYFVHSAPVPIPKSPPRKKKREVT